MSTNFVIPRHNSPQIKFLGSTVLVAGAGDGSSTEDIPSNATIGIITTAEFDDSGTQTPLASVSVNGVTSIEVQSADINGFAPATFLGYLKNFTTGPSRTIAWNWQSNGAITDGGEIFITWWSGVDKNNPIIASGIDTFNGSTGTSTVNLGGFTNGTVVLAHASFYDNTPNTINWNGSPRVNVVYDDRGYNRIYTSVEYSNSTGGSQSISISDNWNGLIVAALKPEPVQRRNITSRSRLAAVLPKTNSSVDKVLRNKTQRDVIPIGPNEQVWLASDTSGFTKNGTTIREAGRAGVGIHANDNHANYYTKDIDVIANGDTPHILEAVFEIPSSTTASYVVFQITEGHSSGDYNYHIIWDSSSNTVEFYRWTGSNEYRSLDFDTDPINYGLVHVIGVFDGGATPDSWIAVNGVSSTPTLAGDTDSGMTTPTMEVLTGESPGFTLGTVATLAPVYFCRFVPGTAMSQAESIQRTKTPFGGIFKSVTRPQFSYLEPQDTGQRITFAPKAREKVFTNQTTRKINQAKLRKLGLHNKLLAFYIMTPTGAYELVTGQKATSVSTDGWSKCDNNYFGGQRFTAGNGNVVTFDNSTWPGFSDPEDNCVEWGGSLEAFDPSSSIILSYSTSGSDEYIELGGRNYYFGLENAVSSSSSTSGDYVHFVNQMYGGDVELWNNGRLQYSFANTMGSIGTPNGDIRIGDYVGDANDFEWDGVISYLRVWDVGLSPAQIKELNRDPWQILESNSKYIISSLISTVISEGPSTVVGSISFDISADKQPTITLTAEATASFLVDLLMQQAVPEVLGEITFAINVDELVSNTATRPASASLDITGDLNTQNTADRPVSFTGTIDLDLLPENTATYLKSLAIDFNADIDAQNTKDTNGTISFVSNFDYAALNELIARADVTLGTNLSIDLLTQLITGTTANFNVTFDETAEGNLVIDRDINLDITLGDTEANQKDAVAADTFDVTLDDTQTNQLDAVASNTFDVTLDDTQTNQLDATASALFNTDLNFEVLNQLAGNVEIEFASTFDLQTTVDGAGIVEAVITFLINQDQVQTNTLTAQSALELLVNLDSQYGGQLDKVAALSLLLQLSDDYQNTRAIPGSIDLSATLTEEQSNTAARVGLMAFDTLLSEAKSTAGSTFGAVVEFAAILNQALITDGQVEGAITFLSTLDQTVQTQRFTDVSMGLNIEADVITNIHLTATGEISLAAILDETEANQLLGSSEITFGHIAGLASINSADLGADIELGTILSVQRNGFIVIFEIVTPDERKFKVHVEDRTLVVGGRSRTVTVTNT